MMKGILVGRKYTTPAFWGPLIPAVIFLVLGVAAYNEKTTGTVLLAVAAGFTVWTVTAWMWVKRGRRWLEVGDADFRVTGPDVDRTYKDGDVRRMSYLVTKNYSQGVPSSVTCAVRLWMDEGEVLEMESKQKIGPAGEFVRWADRVHEDLSKRSEEAIKSGGEVEGEGWTLSRSELRAGPASHAVETLAGVGTFDGHVCVWKKGEEEAVYKVPIRTANAALLERLLGGLLPKGEGAESAGGLGRILFERRAGRTAMFLLWTCWAIGMLVGLGCFLAGEWVGGVVALAVGGLFGFGIWVQKAAAFRCHEGGVMKVGRFGRKMIRYRDIAQFTYGAVRMFYNGVYTGTTLSMKFVSLPSPGTVTIGYSTQIQGMDEELDNLRDHIAKVIAGRMAEELSAGRAVPWTANMTLHPDAIEFRPSGFIGRKEAVKLPFSEVANFGMDQGVFHLWQQGKEKSVMQEQVSAPNFFPGFFLLSSFFSSNAPSN